MAEERSWDRSQPTTRTGNGLQAAGPGAAHGHRGASQPPLPHGPGLHLGNKHVEVYGSRVAGRTGAGTQGDMVTLNFIG